MKALEMESSLEVEAGTTLLLPHHHYHLAMRIMDLAGHLMVFLDLVDQ